MMMRTNVTLINHVDLVFYVLVGENMQYCPILSMS